MVDERLCNPISTTELEPTFSNARLFVTVCDNFLIGPDGKIENIHKTPRKIFEL